MVGQTCTPGAKGKLVKAATHGLVTDFGFWTLTMPYSSRWHGLDEVSTLERTWRALPPRLESFSIYFIQS